MGVLTTTLLGSPKILIKDQEKNRKKEVIFTHFQRRTSVYFYPLKKFSIFSASAIRRELCTPQLWEFALNLPLWAVWPWGRSPAIPNFCFLNLIKEQEVHKAPLQSQHSEAWKSKCPTSAQGHVRPV